MTKERLKLKKIPLFILILVLIPVLTLGLLLNISLSNEPIVEDYVGDDITESTQPVINSDPKPINPYTDNSVTIGKTYYDYKGEEKNQVNSILKHDNTYIQNSGIDYVSETTFDIISIMDGTVTSVKDDETVGKTIEVKHNDGYIAIYQSLSETSVKKGDIINQGQLIGKSGTNELDKEIGNHLHLEIYNNGGSINPEDYIKTDNNNKEN